MEQIENNEMNFKEKIADIRIVPGNFDTLLNIVNELDFFPNSVPLTIIADFFNIQANRKYVLDVHAYFTSGTHYPIHAVQVNLSEQEILNPDQGGYGKATGSFTANLTIQKPGDCCLTFNLSDEDGTILDTFKQYHNFRKTN